MGITSHLLSSSQLVPPPWASTAGKWWKGSCWALSPAPSAPLGGSHPAPQTCVHLSGLRDHWLGLWGLHLLHFSDVTQWVSSQLYCIHCQLLEIEQNPGAREQNQCWLNWALHCMMKQFRSYFIHLYSPSRQLQWYVHQFILCKTFLLFRTSKYHIYTGEKECCSLLNDELQTTLSSPKCYLTLTYWS